MVFNVYQFNSNNSLKNELHTLEAEIENLQNERDALDTELKTKREELTALSSQLEELKNTISSLESDNESLLENLEELKTAKVGLEESPVNNSSTLNLEEIANQVYEQSMRGHSEGYADSSIGSNVGTTNKSPDYISVDGVVENDTTGGANNGYVFDPSDTAGLSTDVTVY